MPAHADAARDLLCGLLALQNGLIDQAALFAAFAAWARDPGRPMADVLLARGALDADDRAMIEALAARHLKKHGGDPDRSLAALNVGRSTREGLQAAAATVPEPDVYATVAQVGTASPADPAPDGQGQDRTLTLSLGTSSSEGQRFRVLRPHARGGLGAVFVALDGELRREVALKQILDHAADDPDSRQRFLMEAEVTGGLEHPGIVPVYGLGTYADGRPFYAMRFIRGDSLKDAVERFHADETLKVDPSARSLELRKLLRRFVDVCNAVDYAHSRGVLHRDIKPGNVIVGKHGETLVVDWGLAKVLGRPEPARAAGEGPLAPSSASGTASTLPGSVLGTPAFMSPEQARGDLDALGPRSDVYSLGATLYCLLTGKAPFRDADVGAVLWKVQSGDFPPPRRADPSIDRALEAVCLKAMALNPDDRYPSCRALADDVERWAADEPVGAWPEPLPVRARRWMKRNRTAVATASATVLAGLVGLSAVAAVQARSNALLKAANAAKTRALAETTEAKRATESALAEARAAKQATESALAEARAAKKATDEALARSEQSRRRAEAVLTFLKNDVLAAARPEGQQGGLGVNATVRKAVDAAEPKIAAEFRGQPEVEAEVRNTLGLSYSYLGEPALAVRQFEQAVRLRAAALGPDHPETLASRANLGTAYQNAGRTAEALRTRGAVLLRFEATRGPDHPETLTARNNLAETYLAAGRTAESVALLEQTLRAREAKLGPDDPDTVASRNNLAVAYEAAGRTAESVALNEQAVGRLEANLGPDHPDTLSARSNLAAAYEAAGRTAEALRMKEEVLRRREAKLGPDHPATLTARNNLAVAYWAAGRAAEAARLHEATLRLFEARLGPDHPNTLRSRDNLARAYQDAGRAAEAARLDEQTLKRREAALGPVHPDTLRSRNNLATSYLDAGRTAEALRLLSETVRLEEANLGPGDPLTLDTRDNLAYGYRADGRAAEAVAVDEVTLGRRERKLGPDHPETLRSRNTLANAYEALGRWPDAEAQRRALLARRRKAAPPDPARLSGDLALLAGDLLKQAKWSEAETVLRECLAIRDKVLPESWSRFNTLSQLGGALLGQGRYAEAEPLVVSGYEGMKAREATIPSVGRPRLPEAAERVVRLYEAWGKPGKAAEWKSRLGLADLPADVFAR